MSAANERGYQFAELSSFHGMPLHEDGWIVMLSEELEYVFVLLGGMDISDGQKPLEMHQFGPHLMSPQIGALVQLVRCSH